VFFLLITFFKVKIEGLQVDGMGGEGLRVTGLIGVSKEGFTGHRLAKKKAVSGTLIVQCIVLILILLALFNSSKLF
jgi:hypothetical protein